MYQARTANGTDVLQWPWLGNANQKWTFIPTGTAVNGIPSCVGDDDMRNG
ncbi:RICIN domain-containing protein [Saccharothrix sp. ALI-22-I]